MVSPCIFVFLLAYLVSGMFAEIFSMTIDTVLSCYVADEEMFPLEKRFADGALKSSIQRTAQKHASKKAAPSPEEKYAPNATESDDAGTTSASAGDASSQPAKQVVINVHQVSHHVAHHHHPEGDVLL